MIDWSRLAQCIDWYTNNRGWTLIEVPWIIPEKFNKATHPFHDGIFHTLGGTLLGSAEQAFVYLDYEGKLDPRGKYIAISPCFRNEPVLDETHQRYFMKIELYYPLRHRDPEVDKLCLDAIVREAKDFFTTIIGDRLGGSPAPVVVPTADGFDIELNGIEIGSYGVRSYEHVHWVYGTALAEPRFTVALSKA